MMEMPHSNMTTHDNLKNLESDTDIIENSIENDFHFNYLTIDTTDEETVEQFYVPTEFIPTVEFDSNVNLNFYETISLPTLQELASTVVAIEHCRRIIGYEKLIYAAYSIPFDFTLYTQILEVEQDLQYLSVPSSIRELVANRLESVVDEMCDWIAHQHHEVISNSFKISDLLFCIWSSEGKIDYRKTALNILSNREINILERFRIMADNCLEDEIKKLPPYSIPERFARRITFDKNPLEYYWLCYLNGDLDKFRIRSGQSMEAYLITACGVVSWPSIEYFWDRLSINEQISKALALLNQHEFQRQIFSKMNQFQKYHVLSTIPYKIMMNFWKEDMYELAFLTWIRFQNTITFETFTDLIIDLLTDSLPNDDEKMNYLVKIWNQAPEDYKNRVLESKTEDVYELYSRFAIELQKYPRCNLDFLFAFLSWGSVDFRKSTMLKYGKELVLCYNQSTVHQLIRLCIPNTNDFMLFENSAIHSFAPNMTHIRCFNMLDGACGTLTHLSTFLHHFISNSDDRIEYIIKILPIHNTGMAKVWTNAIKFIDKYFDTCSPAQIMKYKRRIVWSYVSFHAQCEYDYQELHELIEIISRVLGDDLLKRYKNVALRKFQRHNRWIHFDKIKIHQFLLWCLNYDYLEMKKFKKSLSIDCIFSQAWNKLQWNSWSLRSESSSKIQIFQELSPIDKILLWYFENPDRVKEYKLEKVFGYRNSRPALFVREISTKNVLPWFFENDQTAIIKFKELYKDEPISKLIDTL